MPARRAGPGWSAEPRSTLWSSPGTRVAFVIDAPQVATSDDEAVSDMTDTPLALRLCWACIDILDVDGASITVSTDGDRITLASSDWIAERLDDLQDVLGEGPVPDTLTSGEPVTAQVGDSVQERWPMFVPASREALGHLALTAVPIRPSSEVFGVLMLSRRPDRAGALDPAVTQFLANALGATLLRDAWPDPESLDRSVADTWSGRSRVHQATGMVIAQLGLHADDALALLRAHAYAHETSLDSIARQVLSRRLDFRDSSSTDGGEHHD